MCPPVMGTPNLSCVKTTKPFPVSLHIPSNHMQKCHPKRSEGPVHSGSILRKNFCKYTPSAQNLHLRLRMTPIADAKWLDLGEQSSLKTLTAPLLARPEKVPVRKLAALS